MFEPLSSASGTAKIVNFSILLIVLMAWIGCAVGFGADLARVDFLGTEIKVYQNKVTGAPGVEFSDVAGGCDGGGKGFVAMLVFAFLALLIVFPITFARLAGFSFPKVDSMEQSLNVEFILVSVAGFFYFLAVCIWGGACFTKLRGIDGASVTGTGYGYVLFCFFVVLIAAVLLFLEKGNSNWQVGSGSGSSRSGTIGGSDYDPHADPQAGYSYQGPSSGSAQGGYDQQTSL